MFWLQQEQKRKECLGEKKPKKGLVFEISSDDGFQICAESIEGENCAFTVRLALTFPARSKIVTSESVIYFHRPLNEKQLLLMYSPRTVLVPNNTWFLLKNMMSLSQFYLLTNGLNHVLERNGTAQTVRHLDLSYKNWRNSFPFLPQRILDNLQSIGGMKASCSQFILFRYEHFIGKQHTAHVHKSLLMVLMEMWCNVPKLTAGLLLQHSSVPSAWMLFHSSVLCLWNCRCLEVTDRQSSRSPLQCPPETAVICR